MLNLIIVFYTKVFSAATNALLYGIIIHIHQKEALEIIRHETLDLMAPTLYNLLRKRFPDSLE